MDINIIVLVISVVGVAIAWLGYKKDHPPRHLWITLTPAQPLNAQKPGLRVRTEKRRLDDPHVVELRLQATRRTGFTAADFTGQPVRVDFNRNIEGTLSSAENTVEATISGKTISIPPHDVGAQPSLQFQMMFEGAAERVSQSLPPRATVSPRGYEVTARRYRVITACALSLTLLSSGFLAGRLLLQEPPCNADENLPHVICGYTTNVRQGPSTESPAVSVLQTGTHVDIACYEDGEPQQSPYGYVTPIWYRLNSGGWVSDALLETGSEDPVAKPC